MLPIVREGLDVTGAVIIKQPADEGSPKQKDAPSISLPQQDGNYVSHIALDIGGSLIKLVYFQPNVADQDSPSATGQAGGKLHFVKFETAKIHQAIDFIEAKGLHRRTQGDVGSSSNGSSRNDGNGGSGGGNGGSGGSNGGRIKATGGGAFKFAELFEERLGVVLEKEDEMDCLVAGCNFLLKAIYHEAFSYQMGDGATYVTPHSESDVFPYLLVNIGSGVSMLKVEGDGDHERVSGSSLGGGTFWGLCRLLTKVRAFDEMLELSAKGDNAKVDMLVGDIYGDRDYSSIGLSATTIASSFGKVISDDKDLDDYEPADIAMALCRMVSYNIGQLAYLNAKRYGLSRIIFGGFFIRGHSYTMDTISFAINFWSKGEMKANFLRHEGYLGAVGAFLSVNPMEQHLQPLPAVNDPEPINVRAQFVESFATAAPVVEASSGATQSSSNSRPLPSDSGGAGRQPPSERTRTGDGNDGGSIDPGSTARLQLHVGALQYVPGAEPFPLLANTAEYRPDTLHMLAPAAASGIGEWELGYWLRVLSDQIPTVAKKAADSQGSTPDADERAAAFARSFGAHIERLQVTPNAYGEPGLSHLFELREECLREFGFPDIYKLEKQRETDTALKALPSLLATLDALPPPQRLPAIIQGALAANIFDHGAKAVAQLYKSDNPTQIHRQALEEMSARPWKVDHLAALERKWLPQHPLPAVGGSSSSPWRRAVLFLDNAGADVVLGMLPLARELLKMGCEVVLAANALPAVNDVTTAELRAVLCAAARVDYVIAATWGEEDHATPTEQARGVQRAASPPVSHAASAGDVSTSGMSYSSNEPGASTPLHPPPPIDLRRGQLTVVSTGQGGPCLDLRRVSPALVTAAATADLVVLEGMGRAVLTNFNAQFHCDVLKLAMLKNDHVADLLVSGKAFDCICVFEPLSALLTG